MTRRLSALACLVAAATALATAGPAAADRGQPPSPDRWQQKSSVNKRSATADEEPPVIGTCYLVAPEKVAVGAPITNIPVSLTNGCAISDYPDAAWVLGDPLEPADWIWFLNERRTTWEMYDDTPLGTTTWQPDGAYTQDYSGQYTQNSPKRTVKVASSAKLSMTRSGKTVTVNTTGARYATSLDRNIPWSGARGTVQYKTGNTWTNLRWVYLDSAGKGSVSFTSSYKQEYRVVFPEQTYIWGATTPTFGI